MDPTENKNRLLGAGVVQVWHARLSQLVPSVLATEKFLSETEKSRAGRFLRPEDRARFVAARGMLRCVLGRYLEVAPESVALEYNPHGKPGLAGKFQALELRFNLTHSGDVVALAVAKGLSVGIDVERIRADFDLLELAESRFAKREVEELKKLAVAEMPEAFFRCWTRKEAYLKARGEGLDFEPDKFAVTFLGGQAPAVRWVLNEPDEAARWAVFDLDLFAGYAGALVAERTTGGGVPSIAVAPYVHD